MSNTGLKGIVRVDSEATGQRGYLVRVQWRKRRRQEWLADADHANDATLTILAAIRARVRLELELGKPHSERHIRSSGVLIRETKRGHQRISWRRPRSKDAI
jgi:hypothetical protein